MEIPSHWRLKAQRYRLEGSICPTCGQLTFPPRPVCPKLHRSTGADRRTWICTSCAGAIHRQAGCMNILQNERIGVPVLK